MSKEQEIVIDEETLARVIDRSTLFSVIVKELAGIEENLEGVTIPPVRNEAELRKMGVCRDALKKAIDARKLLREQSIEIDVDDTKPVAEIAHKKNALPHLAPDALVGDNAARAQTENLIKNVGESRHHYFAK